MKPRVLRSQAREDRRHEIASVITRSGQERAQQAAWCLAAKKGTCAVVRRTFSTDNSRQ